MNGIPSLYGEVDHRPYHVAHSSPPQPHETPFPLSSGDIAEQEPPLNSDFLSNSNLTESARMANSRSTADSNKTFIRIMIS